MKGYACLLRTAAFSCPALALRPPLTRCPYRTSALLRRAHTRRCWSRVAHGPRWPALWKRWMWRWCPRPSHGEHKGWHWCGLHWGAWSRGAGCSGGLRGTHRLRERGCSDAAKGPTWHAVLWHCCCICPAAWSGVQLCTVGFAYGHCMQCRGPQTRWVQGRTHPHTPQPTLARDTLARVPGLGWTCSTSCPRARPRPSCGPTATLPSAWTTCGRGSR